MLQRFCRILKTTPPVLSLIHHSGLHTMAKEYRHALERELFEKTYRALSSGRHDLPESISIAWSDTGKPFVKESAALGLSCSHDERVMLCVVGKGGQGCDLEPIGRRGLEEWRALLGTARVELLDVVAGLDKSVERAGSRIWCALEALRKATDMKNSELHYSEIIENCIVFKSGAWSILTFPVRLLRGNERMVAVVTSPQADHNSLEISSGDACTNTEEGKCGNFTGKGPQGQTVFQDRFPLALRENSAVGGGVYFANYFHWIGKMRERSLKPIRRFIADTFLSGHFMIADHSETEIYGHVRNHEVIDAQTWTHKMFGYGDGSLQLHFEWHKRTDSGLTMPAAFSRHQVSWIRVKGHGIVEPVACPEYFRNYLLDSGMITPDTIADVTEEPYNCREYAGTMLGKLIQENSMIGPDDNILSESIVDTTLEHSDLAQNIYFANYFTWQGHLRDRYLYSLSPDRYRKMDLNGKFACIHSGVKHLREGMPFDRIAVTTKLHRLHECGIELYFEYFKIESNGEKVKLAYGTHTAAWVRVDSSDKYIPEPIPEPYVQAILARLQ
jgi:acyl-CoA thioesterase FadM